MHSPDFVAICSLVILACGNRRRLLDGWQGLLAFLVVGIVWLPITLLAGPGWGLITQTAALAVWFACRPWRLGESSHEARQHLRIGGSIFLCGWLMLNLLRYWLHL